MNTRQALTKAVERARAADAMARIAKRVTREKLYQIATEHRVAAHTAIAHAATADDREVSRAFLADAADHYDYAAAALRALAENEEPVSG